MINIFYFEKTFSLFGREFEIGDLNHIIDLSTHNIFWLQQFYK